MHMKFEFRWWIEFDIRCSSFIYLFYLNELEQDVGPLSTYLDLNTTRLSRLRVKLAHIASGYFLSHAPCYPLLLTFLSQNNSRGRNNDYYYSVTRWILNVCPVLCRPCRLWFTSKCWWKQGHSLCVSTFRDLSKETLFFNCQTSRNLITCPYNMIFSCFDLSDFLMSCTNYKNSFPRSRVNIHNVWPLMARKAKAMPFFL